MKTLEEILLGHPVRSAALDDARLIETHYAPHLRFAPHAHERANVSLIVRGQLQETVDRQTVRPTSYSVVVKPAGTVHENHFGPGGAHTFLVELQPASSRALRRWHWFQGGPVARAALRAYACFRAGSEQARDAVIDLLAVIDAELLPERATCPARWIERVRDAIHDSLASGVCVSQLAREFGVHPVYLARAFRARFGCTITEYAHRARVHGAAHAIAGSTLPLAHIAAASGFADQPHMSRLFKRDTGMTPARFRRITSARQV